MSVTPAFNNFKPSTAITAQKPVQQISTPIQQSMNATAAKGPYHRSFNSFD